MGSMMLPKYKGSANSIPADGELPPDIAKYGYLRKLKTMKKKYIVLRLDSDAGPARLEYYDSEKKCRNGQAPKRSIVLKNCFNINRKMDSKHKFALALYTRDDCFALVAETEVEMDAWIGALLKLQQGEASWDGDPQPRPNFEHVWQVNVKNKGLASTSNIIGQHHLCLTSHTLSLVKMNSDKDNPLKFPLISIRRCGHSDCFFFMELGRSAVTGCGELWMATEDNIIAQNMHETILGAMVSSRKCHEEMGPINRPRSASTSDNNNSKGAGSSTPRAVAIVAPQLTPGSSIGSLKDTPFRSRTVSEGHHDLRAMRENLIDPLRPHSTTYTHSISYSPPMTSKPLSPGSSAYSDSAGSSHSIDDYENEYHPNRIYPYQQEGSLHTEPTITEEPSDDYLTMSPGEFDPLDQMLYDMSAGSSVENPSLDYMQMSYTGNHSYPANRHSGMDSSNRKPMYLSLAAQQPDSCPTSPTTDYMEMASPSSSILQDSAGEGYIPMSPVGSLIVDLNHGGTNKRMPASMAPMDGNGHVGGQPPETYSGYVPMAPVRENEGYMEMSSLSSSLPKSTIGAPLVGRPSHVELSTPSQSSHSLQDVSFGSSTTSVMEEYHLDKVKSFFPPSEDDGEVYIKPARAYSIGSRPQVQKSHLVAHLETSRVRAYSFGSQASSRRRETSTYGGIEAELGTLRNIDARNKKSSSAPLLQSGPLQTPTSTTMPPLPNPVNNRGARSSGNRPSSSSGVGGGSTSHNDDLMEIVYHQPAYMRMKPDDHSNRRYMMNTHWQRSNSRSGHDPKVNGKEDRRSQVSNEGVDQAEGFNMGKRNDNDYMEIPRSNSKSGSSWEEQQSDTHRSLQGSSGKKSSKKPEGSDSVDSSRGSHQLPAGSKGAPNENMTQKSEEVDVLGPKKSLKGHSKKPSKQKSECSDYMEMGRGNPVPILRHSSYSLDAPSISQQLNTSSAAGDYVNLDISCRQPGTASSKAANVEFPTVVHNVDTQPHDYMNLQLGVSTPAEETKVIVSEAASRLPDNPQAKTNSTNTLPSCISVSPQLANHNSTSGSEILRGTCKGSCPISTAKNTERGIKHSSHSPERVAVVSETEVAGNRRSFVEGPYENIQLGSSLHLSVERQLNYASLDLAPASSTEDIVPRSPRSSKEPGTDVEVPLSYAEIDFTKSEGLRNTSGNFREGRV